MVAMAKKVRGKKHRKGKREKDTEKYTIPTDLNEPPENFLDYVILIYGRKGIGKTSLASQAPDSVTFMFERGRRNLRIRMIPKKGEKVLNWARFRGYVKAIMEGETGIQRIIVDTVDKAYDACFKWVCNEYDCVNPDDKGKESHVVWNAIRDEFEGIFDVLHEAGIGIIFLSHSREKEIVSTIGDNYNIICPTCTPSAWRYIQSKADFVFFYDYKGRKERCLSVRGNSLVEASCQVEGVFLQPDKKPLSLLLMGSNAKEAYSTLLRAYDNKCWDADRDEDEDEDRPRKKRRKKSRS